MNEKMIGTGLGKGGEMAFRLDDHQMHIERLSRAAAHRLHDQRPDRDIRHKAAVHDVDINPVGARRVDGANFVGKISEVRRQDRRRNDNRPLSRPAAGLVPRAGEAEQSSQLLWRSPRSHCYR